MKQRGFTLIEILVTIAIMAFLVGMVGLSLQTDSRPKEIERETKRLKFYLEMASDEAVFQNVDLGFLLTPTQILPYQWTLIQKADPSDPNSEDKFGWQEFESRLLVPFELPENYEQTARIDGQPITLAKEIPEKAEEINPQFFIASSGEQPVIEIEIGMVGFTSFGQLTGQGLGRFNVKQVNYED